MKSLGDAKVGERVIIKQLCGGRDFTSRVAALGFTLGAVITILQNYGKGPVIVALRDSRVALGRGEAGKVLVVMENDDQTD
jgi:Fe2+ transport system protein FeoA